MKKNKPLLYDPLIINRVKQYLEENVDKTYLDVGIMTKHLQDRFPEYSRRKHSPFRALVEQAYRIVSQSYGMGSQPSSGAESDGSDLEVMDDSASNNIMSNMMNNLYSKSSKSQTAGAGSGSSSKQAEAIDISSDESGDELRANGKDSKREQQSSSKTFQSLTVTKTGNADSSSKGSSSTLTENNRDATKTTTVSSVLTSSVTITQCGANTTQKRHDYTNSEAQPTKKRKLDNTDKADNNNAAGLMRLQQHLSRNNWNVSNLNQNSNESAHFPGLSNGGGVRDASGGGNNGAGSTQALRQRKYKKEVQLRKSRESFQDIGGMEKTLKELCELLMHIKSPDIYFVLGLMPPRGILLHGPPGCGKTLLAHAIAGQLNLPLIEIPATELIAGVSGESEERIRDVFEQASAWAPCVLFIDEIDAISSNRSMAQKDMERRIVSQLISSLDGLKLSEGGQAVLVIGATTRPDVLDPALRRVGRFDHEIAIGIPSRKDRKEILTIICDGLSVEPKMDFDKIAELTPGYVGADLLALVSRGATIAVKRKCAEQIRDFQANRNITIVDLDADDADETSEEKTGENATKNNEDVEKTTEKTVEKTAEKTAEKNAEITAEKTTEIKESTETDAPAQEETTKAEGNATDAADEAKSKDANGVTESEKEQEMEVDASEQESTIAEDSKNADKVTAVEAETSSDAIVESSAKEPAETTTNQNDAAPATVIGEPSLFELLNWLDNPPEDITFVSEFCITLEDFIEAVKVVQPSAKREGFITVPDVTWDDVGSLHDIREELKLAVLAPVKFPEKLARLGLSAPTGVLLCGPPGCGKTLLAKAIANEAGINFISVKGPELMNMYVGESERAVRACFQRARNSAPCVIFFDEFDSLCPKRSEGNESGSGTRVVNQLLTEMDGVEDRRGVYILAATNRPDIIDPAILRPGRLDTILYVGLPEQSDREEILKATTKNGKSPVLADDVDYQTLAVQTDGYTGADLAGLVRQASMLALKESLNDEDINLDDLCVRKIHFEHALKLLRPSVSIQDRKVYEKLRLKYAAPRAFDP